MTRRLVKGVRALLRKLAPRWHLTRLTPLRKLLMLYITVRRPEILPVRYGFKLKIPRNDQSPYVLSLYLDHEYEPEESRLIGDILSVGDIAFDVGANIGYTTCLMATAVGESGQIHAFEPEPQNYDLLSQNIALNGITCVTTNRQALSSHSGSGYIHLAKENRGDHTLLPMPGRERTPIGVTTFDEYVAAHCVAQRVRLVKIDVQGYELEVLRGMHQSLQRKLVDAVMLEYWPARLKMTGVRSSKLLEFLAPLPYTAELVSDTAGHVYKSVTEIAEASSIIETRPHHSFTLLLTLAPA